MLTSIDLTTRGVHKTISHLGKNGTISDNTQVEWKWEGLQTQIGAIGVIKSLDHLNYEIISLGRCTQKLWTTHRKLNCTEENNRKLQ